MNTILSALWWQSHQAVRINEYILGQPDFPPGPNYMDHFGQMLVYWAAFDLLTVLIMLAEIGVVIGTLYYVAILAKGAVRRWRDRQTTQGMAT